MLQLCITKVALTAVLSSSVQSLHNLLPIMMDVKLRMALLQKERKRWMVGWGQTVGMNSNTKMAKYIVGIGGWETQRCLYTKTYTMCMHTHAHTCTHTSSSSLGRILSSHSCTRRESSVSCACTWACFRASSYSHVHTYTCTVCTLAHSTLYLTPALQYADLLMQEVQAHYAVLRRPKRSQGCHVDWQTMSLMHSV